LVTTPSSSTIRLPDPSNLMLFGSVIPRLGWDALSIERRFPEAVRSELARRGHPLKTVGDLEGPCSVEIIRRDAASGMLLAGSDPRRDGWALAW
jgi:gamma-glutamyltranspeptidase/glutathione hydrolase